MERMAQLIRAGTAHGALLRANMELDALILSTPTGPLRELLTEANIHIMEALSKMNEVKKEMTNEDEAR